MWNRSMRPVVLHANATDREDIPGQFYELECRR